MPHEQSKKAAQYVRMSTDMQRYSTENQKSLIALYAASHGFQIVKTYADEGKSGLSIKGRAGLQQLLQDVRGGNAGFGTVLVYDVSRWGRFQDADESAYYEFLCRESGIAIRYCAEEFANDGSITATIIKSIKRLMAAEYSRDLSNRIFLAKCSMTRRGFSHGGRAVFGLRRMLVDDYGQLKGILENGEQKFLSSHRTILVPGPEREVDTVRRVFGEFAWTDASISALTAKLNAEGIRNSTGHLWRVKGVRAMLSNEKYIGNNVFGMTSFKLRARRLKHDPATWVRAEGVFQPILAKDLFDRVQDKLRGINRRVTKFDLLSHLTAIWCKHGALSTTVILNTPGCPSANTFERHFGSMLDAFKAVGYRRGSQRLVYVSTRQLVSDLVARELRRWGHSVKEIGDRKQAKLLVNDELVISIAIAHWFYRTRDGRPRWLLKRSITHQSDLLIIVRASEKTSHIIDYLFVPDLTSDVAQQLLLDRCHLDIQKFAASTLEPLRVLVARDGLYETPLARIREPIAVAVKGAHLPNFSHLRLNRKTAHAKILLRALQRYSASMAAFIAKRRRVAARQRVLEASLQHLFCDPIFIKTLKGEGLDSLPSLTSDRVFVERT